MKYFTLFFAFLSFMPCFTHCNWVSRFSVIGRVARSYVAKHINKNFKTTFQIPGQSHQFTRPLDKNMYPYFVVTSIAMGSSTFTTAHCEERSDENAWASKINFNKPDNLIGSSAPLAIAAQFGFHQTVDRLIAAGADINKVGAYGSALHCAAATGRLKMVKQLVSCGADVWQKDWYNRLPIHAAIDAGHENVAEYLLGLYDDKKSMVNMPCGATTILHQVIDKKIYALFYKILKHATDIDKPDTYGRTPLEYAVENDDAIAVEVLLHAGALPQEPGWLLCRAAGQGRESSFKLLFDFFYDMKDVNQDRLLIGAAENGHLGIVEYLCNHGADINGGSCKASPLIRAAKNGHLKIVIFLCSKKVDLNKKDMSIVGEFTALRLAALKGHMEIVQVLLNAGAELDVETSRVIAYKKSLFFQIETAVSSIFSRF